jgi:hypothetical protein
MTGAIGTHAIGVSSIGARDTVSSVGEAVIAAVVDVLIRWRRLQRR